MTPSLTVVITSYWPGAPVEACVASVLRQRDSATTEVLVIYHGPYNENRKTFPPPVRVLRLDAESLSDARNLGWMEATAEVVAFLDDDAEAGADWVSHITGRFAEDSSLMCLGGIDRPHPDDAYFARSLRLQENFFRLHLTDLKSPALRIKGANLAVRIAAFRTLGGFRDQRDFYGSEDTEFVQRLQSRRMKTEFDPSMEVFHHGPSLRDFARKRSLEVVRGTTPRGLHTAVFATIYWLAALAIILSVPSLVLSYVLVSLVVWSMLGGAALLTQQGRLRDLPCVMLIIAIEFLLLAPRGISAAIHGERKR